MTRTLTLACTMLILTGCVSTNVAGCLPGNPLLNRFGSTRSRAIEVLRSADTLESSHVGAGGAPSCVVTAYRNMLGRDDAAAFRKLFEQAGPVGKVYALAGLYEVDRPAFDRLFETAKASAPAEFDRLDGCVGNRVTRDEVYRELADGALSAWWHP